MRGSIVSLGCQHKIYLFNKAGLDQLYMDRHRQSFLTQPVGAVPGADLMGHPFIDSRQGGISSLAVSPMLRHITPTVLMLSACTISGV
ncbi:hypothetical protein EXD76_03415 [BEV proteobacterium]|nr:hypothetical protein [Candidatus Symbiopectobacterium sp. Chty_BC]